MSETKSSGNDKSCSTDYLPEIKEILINSTLEELSQWYLQQQFQNQDIKAEVAFLIFSELLPDSPHDALFFGEEFLRLRRNIQTYKAHNVAGCNRKCGNLLRFLKLFKQYCPEELDYKFYKVSEGEKELLENGFPLPERNQVRSYQPDKNKTLYLLHNSLPYSSGGYASRAHGLISALRRHKVNCIPTSRLGFPLDENNPPLNVQEFNVVDDVEYHHLLTNDLSYRDDSVIKYLNRYITELEKFALEQKPSIIHAASNFMNGIAANYTARKLGIKSVYEIRGLWEITRLSRHPRWEGSDQYKMFVRMETETASSADRVIVITQALKNEMVLRGVCEENISIIHNGVDTTRFTPRILDKNLKEELGFENKTIIGFVGSIVDYEGLDDLIDAIKILKDTDSKNDFAVLLVGDGAAKKGLEAKVKELRLGDTVIFTGRVPHSEVERYYSIIDIAPFPRKPVKVCEMVSPLKPFEAMAMEKAVIASSVDALAEIVNDNVTGILFKKGSTEELAAKLLQLIKDPALRDRLGKEARSWVVKERDWNILSARLSNIYKELLE